MKNKEKIITKEMISNLTKSKLGMLNEEETKECKDDIIINLGYKAFKSGENMFNNLPCYECAYCGKKLTSIPNIEEKIVIDATGYGRYFNLNDEIDYAQKSKEIKEILLSHMIEKEGLPVSYLVEDMISEFRHTANKVKTK